MKTPVLTPIHRSTTLPALAAVGLVAALALSGCGGGDNAAADPPAAPTDAASTPSGGATSDSGLISPKLPRAPEFSNNNRADGVISDVTVNTCTLKKGPVTATGVVKNTKTDARDIVITINWAAPAGGDVLARGVAIARNVAPGKTATWTTKSTLTSDTPVQCVTTARSGKLANG